MAIKGIRQIFLCSKNTLLNVNPTLGNSPGLSSEAKLVFEDVPVVDYREGDLPDKVKHTLTAKTHQATFWHLLYYITEFARNGCDVQAVGEKESSTPTYGNVFNYTGNNRFMGFDFEYVSATKEKSALLTFEVSLDYAEHNSLLQDSLTASVIDINSLGLGTRGVIPGNYRNPNFYSAASPIGTSLVNGFEIIDRKLTIKSVSSKLEFDRSDLNWININLELTVNRAKAYDLVQYFTKSRFASVQMVDKFDVASFETFNFNQGVLWRKHMVEIGKDKRDIKFTFNRNVTPYDISINTTTNILTVSE
jgi:hypothetical protein